MEAVTSREVYRRNMSEEFSSFLCAANSDFVSTDLCKLVTGRRQSTGQQGHLATLPMFSEASIVYQPC
ncbi:hypothetical protein MPTK1_2g18090 [Marchantia polymorpha subsp. ruderalis]|nr:hypothetical protein Mp_2g18090 [Marchantia polymorpha subsp. ruderalis]